MIRTDTNKVIATIRVGDEPQSVALDPTNRYAFVANAAAQHRDRDPDHQREPLERFRARAVGALS